jgi:hypothetical protein
LSYQDREEKKKRLEMRERERERHLVSGHLLFGKHGQVIVDAGLAEDFSEKVTVGEVRLERVNHLDHKKRPKLL